MMIIMSAQHHHHHHQSGAFSRENNCYNRGPAHRGPDLRRENWRACGVTGDEPLLYISSNGTDDDDHDDDALI